MYNYTIYILSLSKSVVFSVIVYLYAYKNCVFG